jgi:hypothetical protein
MRRRPQWTKIDTASDTLLCFSPPKTISDFFWRTYQYGPELVDRLGSGLDRTTPGDYKDAQRFRDSGMGFWDSCRLPGKNRACCAFSINRIGFTYQAPSTAIGTIDFKNFNSLLVQSTSKAGTVCPGPFYTCPAKMS